MPDYTEVILRQRDDRELMFVLTRDPEVTAQMYHGGQPAVFDGFALRDADGRLIDRITIFDNQTLN